MDRPAPPDASRGDGHGAGDGDPAERSARLEPSTPVTTDVASPDDTAGAANDGFETATPRWKKYRQKKAAKAKAKPGDKGVNRGAVDNNLNGDTDITSPERKRQQRRRDQVKKTLSEVDKNILRLADCVNTALATDEVMELFARIQRSLRSRHSEESMQFDRTFDRANPDDCTALRATLVDWFKPPRISIAEFKQRFSVFRLLTEDAKPVAPAPRTWKAVLLGANPVSEDAATEYSPEDAQSAREIPTSPTASDEARGTLGVSAPLRSRLVLQTAIEERNHVRLVTQLPNTMKMHANIGHKGILRQLINLTEKIKIRNEIFRRSILKAQYDPATHRVIFTFGSLETALIWIGTEIPLQGRLLPLILASRLDPVHELTPAEYPLIIVDASASLSALNIFHLFEDLLALEVRDVSLAPVDADGDLNPAAWAVTLKHHGCPDQLAGRTRLMWGETTLWIQHVVFAEHQPCTRCGAEDHQTFRCHGTFIPDSRTVRVAGPLLKIHEEVEREACARPVAFAPWKRALLSRYQVRTRLSPERLQEAEMLSIVEQKLLLRARAAITPAFLALHIAAMPKEAPRSSRTTLPDDLVRFLAVVVSRPSGVVSQQPAPVPSEDEIKHHLDVEEIPESTEPAVNDLLLTRWTEIAQRDASWLAAVDEAAVQGVQPTRPDEAQGQRVSELRNHLIMQEQARMTRERLEFPIRERETLGMELADLESRKLRDITRAEEEAATANAHEAQRAAQEMARMEREDRRSRLVRQLSAEEAILRQELQQEAALEEALAAYQARHEAARERVAQHAACLAQAKLVAAQELERLRRETATLTNDLQAAQTATLAIRRSGRERDQVGTNNEIAPLGGALRAHGKIVPPRESLRSSLRTQAFRADLVDSRAASKIKKAKNSAKSASPVTTAPSMDVQTRRVIDLDDTASAVVPVTLTRRIVDLDAAALELAASHGWACSMEVDWTDCSVAQDDDMDSVSSEGSLTDAMELDLEELDFMAPLTTSAQASPSSSSAPNRPGRSSSRSGGPRFRRPVVARIRPGLDDSKAPGQPVQVTLAVPDANVITDILVGRRPPGQRLVMRSRRATRSPPKRQLQVTDFLVRAPQSSPVGRPPNPPAPKEDVIYLGSLFTVRAPDVVVNPSQWRTLKRAMGLTEFVTPGEGSCFYYALYGMIHGNCEQPMRTTAHARPRKEASWYKDHLNTFIYKHLEELTSVGVVNLVDMCYKITGSAAVSPETVREVRHFLRQAAKQPCDTTVARKFWAGETELRAAAHWMGVPIFVFDHTADGRVPSATLYYPCPALYPAYVGQETVCQRYLSVKEAADLVEQLKAQRIVPHVLVLNQTFQNGVLAGHFNALRVSDAYYKEWAGSDRRRRDMRLRLNRFMQDSGYYPDPTDVTSPTHEVFDYEELGLSTSPPDSSGSESAYEPSTTISGTQGSVAICRISSPLLRQQYGAGRMTATPDEERKDDTGTQEVGWYDADDATHPVIELSGTSSASGDDNDSVSSLNSDSSFGENTFAPSLPSSPMVPLSQLSRVEWAEIMACCNKTDAARVGLLAGYDKAVQANRLALNNWIQLVTTSEPSLLPRLDGYVSISAACVELVETPGLLVDLLRSIPYSPVVFLRPDADVLVRLGQAIFEHGRKAMIERLQHDPMATMEIKQQCREWLLAFDGAHSTERWMIAQDPSRWENLLTLVDPSATPLRTLTSISDAEWGALLAYMMTNTTCMPTHVVSMTFPEASGWLLSMTGDRRRATYTRTTSKAFAEGDWTAPLAYGFSLGEELDLVHEHALASGPSQY